MNIKSILLAVSVCVPLMSALGQAPTGALLIRDVRVFDGERVLEHRNVIVEGGKISRMGGPETQPPNTEIIDGRGRTLLPGLFDAHLHVPANPEVALNQLASFGITTVLDMSGGGEKLKRIKAIEAEDPANLADVRGAGFIAIAPDSVFVKMSHDPIPTISHPEEAEAWVAARVAEGSDFIKIVYDQRIGGSLSQETVQAIVQAAHDRGKMVAVHALSEDKARGAITAGADGLAHLFIGDSASGDFGQFAAQHHVFVIPTLTVLKGLCGKPIGPVLLADPHLEPFIPADDRQSPMTPDDPRKYHLCKATDEAMQELLSAHVPILAGTDTSDIMKRFMGVDTYGATLHGELKLLVDEGMTPVQALAAATSAPARVFHLTDRGLIRPGMRADLLLVEGDPTKDILATRNIVAVWKSGVKVHRELLSSATPAKPAETTVVAATTPTAPAPPGSSPGSRPNLGGTWNLNIPKSALGPLPPPASEVEVIEDKGSTITIRTKRKNDSGAETTTLQTLTTDGKPSTSTAADGGDVVSTAHWEGAALLVDSKQNYQGMDISIKKTYTISDDAKTLTISASIATPMGNFDLTAIYDKQ